MVAKFGYNTDVHSPHQGLTPRGERESLLLELLDALWERYRGRVEHARRYEELVTRHGGAFRNDHVAFRTIALQRSGTGLACAARPFEALGYDAAGCYRFPDKKLASLHFQHANPAFPKLFVSELRAWELSPSSRAVVERALRSHRPALPDALLAELARPAPKARPRLLKALLRHFTALPWDPPRLSDVQALDRESQFGAWVLLHGYEVNHFTASVDAHGVDALSDIEKTVAALRAAGVPMKAEIEGGRGSKLRQSSTEAAVAPVLVRDRGRSRRVPWTYAYFELAERPLLPDPATGRPARFEGFLGPQAAQLFEMTRFTGPDKAKLL